MNNGVKSYPLVFLGFALFVLSCILIWLGITPFNSTGLDGQTLLSGFFGLWISCFVVESARTEPREWCFWLYGLSALMNIVAILFFVSTA